MSLRALPSPLAICIGGHASLPCGRNAHRYNSAGVLTHHVCRSPTVHRVVILLEPPQEIERCPRGLFPAPPDSDEALPYGAVARHVIGFEPVGPDQPALGASDC